jgi:hypothetical protein
MEIINFDLQRLNKATNQYEPYLYFRFEAFPLTDKEKKKCKTEMDLLNSRPLKLCEFIKMYWIFNGTGGGK